MKVLPIFFDGLLVYLFFEGKSPTIVIQVGGWNPRIFILDSQEIKTYQYEAPHIFWRETNLELDVLDPLKRASWLKKTWFQCLGCAKMNVQHSNSIQKILRKCFQTFAIFKHVSKVFVACARKTCNYFLGADGACSCKNLPKPRRGPRFWWWRWFGSFARGCITVPLLLKCQKRERNIFSCSMYFSLFFFL